MNNTKIKTYTFALEKFVVTGPASDEFKTFTQENGFVIDYRNSVDGFIR